MSGSLALVYPVLALVLWTLILGFAVGATRVRAVRRRQVRLGEVALSNSAWPEHVKKISNNYRNQFESPVLFYALCGIATYTAFTNVWMVFLAWAYVATRLAHSLVHITNNRVIRRAGFFGLGLAILIVMWVFVAAHLLIA